MREVDDRAVARASVFCDTLQATVETGELIDPIRSGVLDPERIVDLGALCAGRHPGRRSQDEITLFKSLGLAIEDIASAHFLYAETRRQHAGVDVELGGMRH